MVEFYADYFFSVIWPKIRNRNEVKLKAPPGDIISSDAGGDVKAPLE